MQAYFQKWSIVAKLRVLALLGIVAMVAVGVWQGFSTYYREHEARQTATRQVVESAYGVVEWAYGQEATGKLTREAAQKIAHDVLAKMRYSGSEYFFITDLQAKVIMHPIKPELDNTDASGIKDPNGKALFVAFADKVKASKQGYVDYLWPKPGKEHPVEKLTYVKGFEPWGWIVGSGIYIDDIRDAVITYAIKLSSIMLLALVLTLVLTRSISRSIVRGLNKAIRVAQAIADGDISQTIAAKAHDEVGQLMQAMGTMTENLRRMVGMVQEAAHSMEVAASEIASGNNDLSQRTEQTASDLQRTAAATGEINNSVTQSANALSEASQLSSTAAQTASHGNEIVLQVVNTMGKISESSHRIGDITGVIDGIAFQTNILALNAAVEAARAGEQGRGFAVVASEVRALAQRSAEAAKEIKTLINDSVDKVSAGGQLVSQAGDTMQQVVDAVQRVSVLVDGIRMSNQEQTSGMDDINRSVVSLEQTTIQNAALVEESAAAAQSMREQAHRLIEAVQVFKLTAA